MKRGIIIAFLVGTLILTLASPALAQNPHPLPNPPFNEGRCAEMGTKGAPFVWDPISPTGACLVSPSRR